jgi:dihydrolipoamide dehydrogenase
VGEADGAVFATADLASVAQACTYSVPPPWGSGHRLTGACAARPEAGEWLQQATLAIRAEVPLDVFADTVQPFPTLSEIYLKALQELRNTCADCLTAAETPWSLTAPEPGRPDRCSVVPGVNNRAEGNC